MFCLLAVTDQIAQVHRSPGFITSNLVGTSADGSLIKEFEASHGTVSDLWNDHLAGRETSLNPLGLVEAIMGAMQHAAVLGMSATVILLLLVLFAQRQSHAHVVDIYLYPSINQYNRR